MKMALGLGKGPVGWLHADFTDLQCMPEFTAAVPPLLGSFHHQLSGIRSTFLPFRPRI